MYPLIIYPIAPSAGGQAVETRDEGVDRGATHLRHGEWTSGLEGMTRQSGLGTSCE